MAPDPDIYRCIPAQEECLPLELSQNNSGSAGSSSPKGIAYPPAHLPAVPPTLQATTGAVSKHLSEGTLATHSGEGEEGFNDCLCTANF